MKWSAEQIERCKQLWVPGTLTSREISATLSQELGQEISFSAVIARMHRCGLSNAGPGSNQARAKADAAAREQRRADQAKKARLRERERQKRKASENARKPVARRRPPLDPGAALPTSLRIPITALREEHCRFIADDPVHDSPATYCGHQASPGSRYCPAHRAICITAIRPHVTPRTWSVR